MKTIFNQWRRYFLVLLMTLVSTSASAQVVVEEIIVTGLKRASSLLDAPVAVTVFTAKQIEATGVSRPEDYLSLVSNVGFVKSNKEGDFYINMRGQATVRFAESAVAVVVDGVQLALQQEFNSDYFDIEQIEVLKGPQGAFYGRNATAGAIIVNTRGPGDEWAGNFSASYGNWNSTKINGGLGGPLTDKIGVHVAASMTDSDGPYVNPYTDEKVMRWRSNSARVKFLFDDEDTKASLIFSGSHGTGGGIQFSSQIVGTTVGGYFIGTADTNDVFNIPFVSDLPGNNTQDKFSSAFRYVRDLDGMTFESVTSYSYINEKSGGKGIPFADFDNPDNDLGIWEFAFGNTTQKWQDNNRAFTQELRLSSDNDSRISWQLGAYYQKGRKTRLRLGGQYTGAALSASLVPNPIGSTNPTTDFNSDKFGTENYSPFGNVQIALTDSFDVSVAVRYETEKRSVETTTPPGPNTVTGAPTYNQCVLNTGRAAADCKDNTTFKQLQPKVTASYSFPNERGSVYASYGKGFKAGGFNSIGVRELVVAAAVGIGADSSIVFLQNSYDKETSNAYELGFKTRFMDDRVSLNGAVFKTNVKNAQQFEFVPLAQIQAVSRIDGQKIEGFEFDLNVIASDWLTIFGAYGYTDAKISSLVAAPAFVGNRAPFIAKYNAAAGYQLTLPVTSEIDFVQRLEYKGVGSVWYDASNLLGSKRNPVDLIDARVGFSGDSWDLTLWGRNLTNEKYASEAVPLFAFLNIPQKAPTRSYGIEARYRF
ncbi:MAG: hypothetical protein CMM25_09910 [Rhodospirillaceae bacterium]|nr:hypothetical protein [Rhodospirillaceae bacterium]